MTPERHQVRVKLDRWGEHSPLIHEPRKVVDLDELVQCQAAGKITVGEAFDALVTLQRWLQMLHGWQVEKDFPPRSLPRAE